MIQTPFYLKNNEAVVSAFGYWPSFHDANVLAFRYAKESDGKVELSLHGWEITNVVNAQGYLKLIKHHLVQFAFQGISDADIDQFVSGNILFDLKFSTSEEFLADGRFKVTLDSAMGGDLCGSFFADEGEVLDVVPCDPKGESITI